MVKLFGLGGKKEPEEIKKIGKGFIPSDKVKELSSKGFSEPEMIDVLRKEGFSAEEIDRALTQALKVGVTGGPEMLGGQPPGGLGPPPRGGMDFNQPLQTEEQFEQPASDYAPEEVIESIVQERMGEMDQKLDEFRVKYTDLERNIANLHHQLSNLSKGRSQTEQSILMKLDSFRDEFVDMNGKVSSLEKAFKDTLPALIESVRSLIELVERIKEEKK